MEILGFIAVIIFAVLIRAALFLLVQGIFIAIGKLLMAILSIFIGSTPEKPRPSPVPQPRRTPNPVPRPRSSTITAPRRKGTVDELGVDSDWTKEQKRAHLLREYAKYNARMQVLKDKWLRDDCQRQLEAITRAIMELDRQG